MTQTSFKSIAIKIISEANKPLHYREITRIATEQGLLKSDGKTPWATMNAQLSMDIVNNGESSQFYRAQPGYFGLREQGVTTTSAIKKSLSYVVAKHKVTDSLNTKQKGDIAEARVAELLTLYGDEGLSCYRPISDDEGIDIIAKRREKLEVAYIQVKSSYGYKDRGFVSSVREKQVVNKERMILVFVYFDLSGGDLFDQIFCIPAPDFLRLTANEDKKPGERVFTVGLRNPDKSKYAEFMIEKRELANRIIEIMDKL
jgi:Holliday junction resolvase-like predicted endonuclease